MLGVETFWRYQYYGTWLPNTAIAKTGVSALLLLKSGSVYIAGLWVTYAAVWVPAMAIARDRRTRDRIPDSVAMLALYIYWWLLYLLVIGGDHFVFGRFAMPAVLLGAVLIGRRAAPFVTTSRRAVSVVVLVSAVNGLWWMFPDRVTAQYEVQQAIGWADTGRWLRSNAPIDRSIATLVAGAIPYYSTMHTYDLLALVDATIAKQGRVCVGATVGHQRVHSEYLLGKRPDYIIFPSSGLG